MWRIREIWDMVRDYGEMLMRKIVNQVLPAVLVALLIAANLWQVGRIFFNAEHVEELSQSEAISLAEVKMFEDDVNSAFGESTGKSTEGSSDDPLGDGYEEPSDEFAEEGADIITEEAGEDAGNTDVTELQAEEILSGMTLEEKVYQLFMVSPEQLTGINTAAYRAGEKTEKALEAQPVGGIIYNSSNLKDPDQTTAMISGTQSFSDIPLLIAVDEEGGEVTRIAENAAFGVTSFPDMTEIQTEEEAGSVGRTIGTYLSELGFNMDLAPVADVLTNEKNTVVKNRVFSSDPVETATLVAACVSGFEETGTITSLKHFPGHGNTSEDSHTAIQTVTNRTLEEMEECELLPFRAGIEAGSPCVMIGHIFCPEIVGSEKYVPASLSYEIVTGILREEMGFEGVVITDSMQMESISGTFASGDAAVQAIQAGVDMILEPESLSQAEKAIVQAVQNQTITEARIDESVLRILCMKIRYGIIE